MYSADVRLLVALLTEDSTADVARGLASVERLVVAVAGAGVELAATEVAPEVWGTWRR